MNRTTRYNEKQKQYTRLASRLAVDNKLGKLEDLEDELGFDLEKLQEIDYIYAEDENNILRKYEFIGVNFKEKKIWFWYDFMPMYLSFESYKETFWLKEDRSE